MERIPILQMGAYLLVTIQVDMQDQTAMALQEDLADKIAKTGASGVLIDISALEIVDSFVGRLACIMQGAADTTFYIIALYFGSVGIRKTRYAVSYGLLADLVGIVAAIFVAYLFFG